jgi:hypothetical protein
MSLVLFFCVDLFFFSGCDNTQKRHWEGRANPVVRVLQCMSGGLFDQQREFPIWNRISNSTIAVVLVFLRPSFPVNLHDNVVVG